jgi:hypothetical protein
MGKYNTVDVSVLQYLDIFVFFLFAVQIPAYAQESIIIGVPSSAGEPADSEDSPETDPSSFEKPVIIHVPSSAEMADPSEDPAEPCTLSAQDPVNPSDLTMPCNLSAEELAPVLKGLSDYAEEFLAAEEKYGVNAVFLASLAAFESGWGSHCFRPNNLFGWGKKEFASKEECIDFVARRISEWYLAEGGKFYNGTGLGGVNACYNGSAAWYDCMLGMMRGMTTRLQPLGPVEIASL